MTVTLTKISKTQNDLLNAFAKLWAETGKNLVAAAIAFKACVDAGCDMSKYGKIGPRLLQIAAGNLAVPTSATRLLVIPEKAIAALVTLPFDAQTDLWNNGASILRGDRAQTIQLDEIRPNEAARLVDALGGKGRVLTPAEQKSRLVPRPPRRRDQEVKLRMTYEEVSAATLAAHKAKKPLARYLGDLIRKDTGEMMPPRRGG